MGIYAFRFSKNFSKVIHNQFDRNWDFPYGCMIIAPSYTFACCTFTKMDKNMSSSFRIISTEFIHIFMYAKKYGLNSRTYIFASEKICGDNDDDFIYIHTHTRIYGIGRVPPYRTFFLENFAILRILYYILHILRLENIIEIYGDGLSAQCRRVCLLTTTK